MSEDVRAGSGQLSQEELAERRKNWHPPKPRIDYGVLGKYARRASSADKGAVVPE